MMIPHSAWKYRRPLIQTAIENVSREGYELHIKSRLSSRIRMVKGYVLISSDNANQVFQTEALSNSQNNFD
jgi:hypothetical protein